MSAPDLFSMVFLCTGNRFRSPLAETLFRQEADGLPIHVSSLGTLELQEGNALPEAVEEARRLGVDLRGHRTTPLSQRGLADVDLVIGFERKHVMTAVVEAGAPRDRTFTLAELAMLLAGIASPALDDPAERAREVVRQAAARRLPDANLTAVPETQDPLGRSAKEQRAIAEEVNELVQGVKVGLFG
jgi:protein-tyrosine phosphatase